LMYEEDIVTHAVDFWKPVCSFAGVCIGGRVAFGEDFLSRWSWTSQCSSVGNSRCLIARTVHRMKRWGMVMGRKLSESRSQPRI
jgi:hypothetical protein